MTDSPAHATRLFDTPVGGVAIRNLTPLANCSFSYRQVTLHAGNFPTVSASQWESAEDSSDYSRDYGCLAFVLHTRTSESDDLLVASC